MSPRRSFAISRNEVHVLRRDPGPLIVLIVMPLIVVPIFRATVRAVLVLSHYPHASGAEFAVPGQAIQFLFFLAPTVGFTFFREHMWGTWDRLRASRATSAEIILGKALPMTVIGALQFAALFALGFIALDLHVHGSIAGVVLVSASVLACVVALGIAMTALSRSAQQLSAMGYLGGTLFGALGGALVPLATLPAWARDVAPVTPQYWAMRGYNALILNRQGFGAALRPSLMLCAFAAMFAAIALGRFRFSDEKVGWS